MKYWRIICLCAALFVVIMGMPPSGHGETSVPRAPTGDLLVLCYHGILPRVPAGDTMSVSQREFVSQLEYLNAHGYTPVSVATVLAAVDGHTALPPKAVLLSFDDAYRSFYQTIYPLLKKYGYPAMLAVVGSWIDGRPPEGLSEPLMSWSQISEVAHSGLVEIASHSYNLHRAVQYNPAGNVGAVVSTPAYLKSRERYETEAEYREKLEKDFQTQAALFEKHIGIAPRAMVWPYGRYNRVAMEIADAHGFRLGFSLADGKASTATPRHLNRLLMGHMPIDRFIYKLNHLQGSAEPIRAMQVDLDLVYDPKSYEATDRNLGKLIDRLAALKVNTVYLQAFSDAAGTGNIGGVYFENGVLPVKADIFSHAVHQMIIRGMTVYAWLPVLSYTFPEEDFNRQWRVREYVDGAVRSSTSWYKRLTPFSPEVRARIGDLYEALAAHAQIHGILFQDDAYLAEREDYNPAALKAFSDYLGKPVSSEDILADSGLADRWTDFKTRTLIQWTAALAERIRKYRPEALFARNLYANVLLNPRAEFWFAQSYDQFLDAYDQVVVMAYPQMEKADDPLDWLQDMARRVAGNPRGPDKTVFKLQAYDWKAKAWIDSNRLLAEMRTVLSAGGRHLAYYPDNFWEEQPRIDIIRNEMSTRTIKDVTAHDTDADFRPY